jgi:hypothetical protein
LFLINAVCVQWPKTPCKKPRMELSVGRPQPFGIMCLRTASSSQPVRIAQRKVCLKVLCVSAAPARAYASSASRYALEFGTAMVDTRAIRDYSVASNDYRSRGASSSTLNYVLILFISKVTHNPRTAGHMRPANRHPDIGLSTASDTQTIASSFS